MAKAHRQRLTTIVFIFIGLTLATVLILKALSQNINLFYTPTQVFVEKPQVNKPIRVGGMVVKGSIQRDEDMRIRFLVTDFESQLTIRYRGILPDLFKEGQGVVALGKLDITNEFEASEILAKHDENYMPPELAKMEAKKLREPRG